MSKHSGYLMDYIPPNADGKNPLYAAVMYARKLIREDQPPALSIVRAAKKYHVPKSAVAHYVGQVGNTIARRNIVPRPLTRPEDIVPLVNKRLKNCTKEDAKTLLKAGMMSTSSLSNKQFLHLHKLLMKDEQEFQFD